MKDSTVEFLVVNLSKIEAIVEELPRIGKRSELKVKADEILRLTEMVRRQAYALDDERTGRYTPDLGQMFGGVRSGKKTEGGESSGG